MPPGVNLEKAPRAARHHLRKEVRIQTRGPDQASVMFWNFPQGCLLKRVTYEATHISKNVLKVERAEGSPKLGGGRARSPFSWS